VGARGRLSCACNATKSGLWWNARRASVEAAQADQQRARSSAGLGQIPNAAPRSGLGTDSQRNVSRAELHPLPAAGRDPSREMQRGTSVSCLSEGWVVSRGASSPGERGAAPSWGNTPDATPHSGLACRPSRGRSYAATVNKMSRMTALALAAGTGRAVPRGLQGDFSPISEGFRAGFRRVLRAAEFLAPRASMCLMDRERTGGAEGWCFAGHTRRRT